MKTSNLMQGDWVRTNDGELRKVVAIDVGYVTLEDGDNILTKSDEHIFPIEITEDILERNGFEKHRYVGNYEVWESEDGRTLISHISNMNGRDWSVHIDNKDFQSICSADFEYVHELQHILRHCEIKKEIKL